MFTLWAGVAVGASTVNIPTGSYEPLYPAELASPRVQVDAFVLDVLPVTAGKFSAFVEAHPQWSPARITPLFADDGYLSSTQAPDEPVVNVSWFAARAYCAEQGKRLPTEDEWEYVARASATQVDGSSDPELMGQILQWYGQPGSTALRPVGQGEPNVFGVHDMHGLVWEWVEDFNNTLFGTDGRDGGDEEDLRFCGAGALSATDPTDYASFMRIAFRSSLRGSYTMSNLGFRCATDAVLP